MATERESNLMRGVPVRPPVEVSAEATTGRTILLVGDETFTRRMRERLATASISAPVETVANYVMALGRLGTLSPDAIIGDGGLAASRLAVTARSLRQLAPDARLVIVCDDSDAALGERAVAAGFDGWVTASGNGVALTDVLRGTTSPPSPVMPDDPLRFESIRELAGVGAAPTAEETGPLMAGAPSSDHEIAHSGDLIRRLLRNDRDLRPAVMQVITGWPGMAEVRWAENEQAIPTEAPRAAVSCEGHSFGYLHGPVAVAREAMQGAADWLGRWLALERRMRMLTELAFKDELTGAWNKRYFNRALDSLLQRAAQDRFGVTLLVFDIDDFKQYNDRHGHAAGDEILSEAARLMRSVVRDHDIVARIGGDEFAVIFWDAEQPRRPNSHHPANVLAIAERFQHAICSHRFPKLLGDVRDTLTISGGLAGFPWDGRTPAELLDRADQMAIRSKRQGKNAITLGPGAKRACDAVFGEGHVRPSNKADDT